MKKILNGVIAILLGTLIVMLNVDYVSTFKNEKSNSKFSKMIIIDAGHGGIDGGAVSKNGTVEKDINLSIAQKLKGYLEESGNCCVMIREVDEGLYSQSGTIRNKKNEDLKNRKDIIKESNGDIFISIHLNFFPQSQYYGAQVFCQKNDEESLRLAKCLQSDLINVLDKNNNRIAKESDDYYILRDNKIPSVIVECGFLSNPEEEKLLKDENYQNKISWAIFTGINDFFDGKESKQ